MAKINGTNLAASIVPFTTDDQFATHHAKYGQGGWQEVATIQDRDAITTERREAGMAVYVIATQKVYILGNDLTTWTELESGKVDDVKVNGTSVVVNKIANVSVPTKTSDITNDSGFITKSVDDLDNYTKTSDLPDVIDNTTSTSTTDALSANQGRVLQSEIESLQSRGRFLSVWNSATGLAETNPPTSPYTYHNGDYFIVGTVAASGGTNYKPDGSSYTTGVASTAVETETVAVNDTYLYDGTVWHLQQNAQRETTFANVAGSPYDNQNLATALNAKADLTDIGNATLTIQKNSTQVGTFTANSKTDATINITVPTTASDVGAVAANADITGATKCKITYDSKGLVTAGADLAASDIPDLSATYQPLLTAGTNISITNNVISSTAQESFFRGRWNSWNVVPTDASLYPVDTHSNHKPLVNDFMVVTDASGYRGDYDNLISITIRNTGGDAAYPGFSYTFIENGSTIKTVIYPERSSAEVSEIIKEGMYITLNRAGYLQCRVNFYSDAEHTQSLQVKYNNNLVSSITSYINTTITEQLYYANLKPLEGSWRFYYDSNYSWDTDGKLGWKPQYQVEETLPDATDQEKGIAKLYTTTGNNTDGAVDQATITTALGEKQDVILDLETIKSGASLGATSLQPNDDISELNNDAGYTTNVGTVTSVNNVQPDANGNVTITIPSSDVTDVQIYGVSKVTSGVANLNVVEQVTSLPLSDVWMGRTVQYVGPDYPSNDIYRGYYYIYETRPYGEHLSRTGWWQLDVQPGGAAVNDGTLTIQKNGTQVGTFTANQSTNSTINITVPTNTSDLTNNSGFITSSDIPVTDVTVGGTSVVTSGVAAVPAIPTVNDSTITLTQGGTTKGTFTLNQSSGTTINFDAGQVIQVDASTMPDASTCPGRIVQWVGDTSSMTGLTKGYFYISGTHMVYSATITAEDWSPSYTSIIADFFVHKFKQVIGRNPEFDEDLETIYFLYDGSKWDLVDIFFGRTTTISDVTLSEYGVTVTGTPTNGSKLNIVPTVDFVSTWNRLNVQPDNGATVVYDAINEELTIS